MTALGYLLRVFSADFPLPILIALHLHPWQDRYFLAHFAQICPLRVKEADDKEAIAVGTVYFAPPNYHLLVEDDLTFSLSVDEKVNYARPSIDVLFESAADALGCRLAGVVLTGANHDGAQGLRYIKGKGGMAIVQDPHTAENAYMPNAALEATAVDHVLPLEEMGHLLGTLSSG